MAGYKLERPREESVLLEGGAVQRLLTAGNGDAALLYIAMLRSHGTAPEVLRRGLKWPEPRLESAMRALSAMRLITLEDAPPPQVDTAPPPRPTERPEYTRADMARALEGPEFAQLTAAVEEKLGKKLTTPDMAILLGLYDDVGLPSDVIFLLVGFCVERSMRQYGPGRKPTLRQIEREGYAWARMELMDMESADAYIRRYQQAEEALPRLMTLLGLGDRKPSPSEEKYLRAWVDMGFPGEVIELAYDKTILKCKELKWPYMNKILAAWKQKGFKTVEDVERGERPQERRSPAKAREENARNDVARMDRYLQELRRQREKEGN